MSSVSATGSSRPTCKVVGFCPAWWAVSDGRDMPGEEAGGRSRKRGKAPKSSFKFFGRNATTFQDPPMVHTVGAECPAACPSSDASTFIMQDAGCEGLPHRFLGLGTEAYFKNAQARRSRDIDLVVR